jgi:hypothetical protein
MRDSCYYPVPFVAANSQRRVAVEASGALTSFFNLEQRYKINRQICLSCPKNSGLNRTAGVSEFKRDEAELTDRQLLGCYSLFCRYRASAANTTVHRGDKPFTFAQPFQPEESDVSPRFKGSVWTIDDVPDFSPVSFSNPDSLATCPLVLPQFAGEMGKVFSFKFRSKLQD